MEQITTIEDLLLFIFLLFFIIHAWLQIKN